MSGADIRHLHDRWRRAQRAHHTLDGNVIAIRRFSDIILSVATVLAFFRSTQMWYGWPTAQTDFVVGRSFNMAGQLYVMFALSLLYIALNFREFMAGLARATFLLKIVIAFIGLSILISHDRFASSLALLSAMSMMLPPLLYYWRFGPEGTFRMFRIFAIFTIAINILYAVAVPQYAFMSGSLAGDMRGLFPHKNGFGHMMAMMFIFLLPTIGRDMVRPGNLLLLAFCALAIVCVLLSHSSTAVVDILMGLGVIAAANIIRRLPPGSPKAFLIVAAFLALVAILYFGGMFMATMIAEGAGKDLTFSGRTEIWAAVLPHLFDYPFNGYGFGIMRLPAYFEPILSVVSFPVNSPHNTYLEMMLNIGIPATVCWILFLLGRLYTKLSMTGRTASEVAILNRQAAVIIMVLASALTEAGRMFAPNVTWPVLILVLPLWHAYGAGGRPANQGRAD